MDWDTVLRAVSALAWSADVVLLIRSKGQAPEAVTRLAVLSLAVLLVVIAAGPLLVPEIGGWAVKTLYTATASALLLIGIAVGVLVTSEHD